MKLLIKKCVLVFLLLTMTSLVQAAAYEVVAKLPKDTPPGNIAISQQGRIFLSVHDFFPSDTRLVELLPDGSTKPYPNKDWASAPKGENQPGIHSVLGLNTDGQCIR